jgi:hypothetical protein
LPASLPQPGRRGAALTVAAAVLAIAAATLFPTGDDPAERMEWCLLCGERGLADAILNVFLFIPLGAALALRGTPARRTLLAGAVVSLAVEVLQHLVPGRDPNPADVLFNTLGTGLGFLLLRTLPLWADPPRECGRRALAAAVALPLLALLAAGVLLGPGLPRSVYFGQWTADLGYLEWYRGKVLEAHVGEVAVPSRRMEAESPRLRELLLRGAPVRVEAVAGPPPPALAPVFSIYDHLRREVVLLGVDREDAVFRYRTLGTALRLDQPDLRFPGALRGVRAGEPLRLALSGAGRDRCLRVNAARECSLGFTVADAWTLLLFPSRLFRAARGPLGALWLALLFLPAGTWIRGRRQALAAGAAVAAGLLGVPFAAGLLPTPAWAVAAALGGMAAGALARAPLRTLAARLRG